MLRTFSRLKRDARPAANAMAVLATALAALLIGPTPLAGCAQDPARAAAATDETPGPQEKPGPPSKQDGGHSAAHSKKKPLPSAKEIAMLPPDGGKDYNRLIHEKSPYLLQHADNPVDWYPWGDEAFAKAKETGKPIFLSVGYSTCHWCHVMAHESFESERVAKVLNALYIPVKVDREERPDVDEIYMAVTQMMTGHGGWPNSVFLMADGRPFYAGTYFPPNDSPGRPGFVTILNGLAKSWKERREDIEKQAEELVRAVKQRSSSDAIPASGVLSRNLVKRAIDELKRNFDETNGGFGSRPKFPPHGSLDLILYEHARTKDAATLAMATRTLDAIALGGVHDHVGGGFARYSTDEKWFLPHFEKMLYDNAQLSRAYVKAWQTTKQESYRRIATRTYDWALREMRSPEGAFWSAYDADSEGEEGKFYLWAKKEVEQLLGKADAERFCRIYNLTAEGNYYEEASGHRPGTNIIYLEKSLEEWATEEKMKPDALREWAAAQCAKLYGVRKNRIWPHLDDKILVSWNALMIGSLAYAGKAFDTPKYVDAAKEAALFVLTKMRDDGRLKRTYRDGGAKLNVYLDDYTFLANALLDLHEATGEARWLDDAVTLMETAKKHYGDPKGGGYFFVSDDHEDLLVRSKQPFDGPIPSGNGMAALALVRLAKATGTTGYIDDARASFAAFLGVMERAPRAAESFLHALALYYDEHATASPKSDADISRSKAPVTAALYAERRYPVRGSTVRLALRLDLEAHWHINANTGGPEHLIPTEVRLGSGAKGLSVGAVAYPQAKKIKVGGDEIPVFEGGWLQVPLTVATDAPLGKQTVTIELSFQACNEDRCFAPAVIQLPLEFEIVEAADELPRHAKVFEQFDK